ncbi:MAG: hydrogenase nickel incorporation protein HypA [Thermoproteota archaeon]
MHEWALAEAVIKTTLRIAEENRIEKVTEVSVKIGEMQQVELEIFKLALTQLKPAKFENTKFKVEIARTGFKCKVCNHEWFFEGSELTTDVLEAMHFLPEVSHAYIKCPKCGSPDFETVKGRGVWIESVRGVRKDD